ncbi:MAG: hypothetical protein IH598_08480 [Bacteroidales bacterium]|nr:hypothetical protein [Bacteroidales bacterium]
MKTILEKREFIRSVKTAAKDDFLFELMHSNDRLLMRFEEFVKSFDPGTNHVRRELNVISFEDELQQAYEAFKEGLEELDFEHLSLEKWRSEPGEYLDDHEVKKEVAKSLAFDYFEAWRMDIMTEISSGYHYQGLAMIAGMMAGALEARIHDPHLNLGDPPNLVFIEWIEKELDKLIKDGFEDLPAEDSDILTISESLFQFAKNHSIGLLKHLPQFYDTLVKTPELAKSLIASLDENSIPLQIIPKLADLLTTKTGDEQIWLNFAETIFPDDFDLAKELLDYYYNRIPEDFEHMAMIAFKHHGLVLADYLAGKMKEGSPLFCSYQLARAGFECSISIYEQARKYISRNEGIAFAKEHPDFEFKLGILTKEEAWDDILLMAKSKQAADQLNDLLPPIMKHFPDDCLAIIESNAAHSFKHHRNRDGYSRLVGFLKLGTEIPGKDEEIKTLINYYVNISPRLPALKDELRNYGFLVNESEKPT